MNLIHAVSFACNPNKQKRPSMTKPIRRVAVLGAGVMGAGIAAHCANAGIPVLLLDIVPPDLDEKDRENKAAKNKFAAAGLKGLLKARPAQFFHKDNAQLVEIGNFDDDLDKVGDYDIVVEAIIERLDIKIQLFEKLEKIVSGDTIVASNTSGLRIQDMLEGRSDRFKKHFLVTHFFNPPRYMKLLELVAGPDTDPAVSERCETWGKEQLGKGIVWAKDSPNFVGNRIGAHAMMASIHLMLEEGLAPEDLDAISGLPTGHPKSATFRTGDMVGIDTLVHVVDNCYDVLTEDEDRDIFKVPEYIRTMTEKRFLGNKTKGGFYKKTKEGIQTFDPTTQEYRPKAGDGGIKSTCKEIGSEPDPAKRIRTLIGTGGKVSKIAWKALSRSLAYTARRVGEICDEVDAIDNAMRWGYNWELGPFEVWDALGFVKTLERMEKDGTDLPDCIKKMRDSGAKSFYDGNKDFDLLKGEYVERTADPREIGLEVMRKGDGPVLSNAGAEAWDLGDGVLGVTFKSKANSLDPDVIEMLGKAVEKAESDFRGMMIVNQGEHFCVGANLMLVLMAAQQKNWEKLREIVAGLQGNMQRLKYASVPVIALPYGMTLGGGLEVCMACDGVQAAAETYSGQVEVAVGLLPGGAGNLNMLWRALEGVPDGAQVDTQPIVAKVFQNIAMANVATSGVMAQRLGYFRNTDGISFDRARQLYEGKQRVIGMAESGYHPPIPRAYRLPGESGIATMRMMIDSLVAGGHASEHDGLLAMKVAEVLCGGVAGRGQKCTEEYILELECEAFVSLCGEPKSQARMQHMLMKNKPLRN